MSITTVEYRRLVSHGNYENTTIGAERSVEAEETPAEALRFLKEWVDGQVALLVGNAEEKQRLNDDMWQLRGDVGRARDALRRLQERWAIARAALEAHGVTVEPLPAVEQPIDDIPF